MSNAASNYVENRTLDFWLNGNSLSTTTPGTLNVALFHGTAGAVGSTGTVLDNLEQGTLTDEITLGSYARQTISFGSASSGSISNDQTVTFPTATANYDGDVTCLAIVDGSSNVLFYGELTVSKTVTTGDTFQIAIGNCQVSLT
jgi:phage tail sheath gpL-like